MRISDWSSDVCSSDLAAAPGRRSRHLPVGARRRRAALRAEAGARADPHRRGGRPARRRARTGRAVRTYPQPARKGIDPEAGGRGRSERRRGGKEGVSQCRSRCEAADYKKKAELNAYELSDKYKNFF